MTKTNKRNDSLELLKSVQESLELNQRNFGTYIGVSIKTISNWMTETRQVPEYVAEMAARIAKYDLKALDEGEPTSRMIRWAVISGNGTDEWIHVCGSKADAIREAEDDWKHLTPAEREKCDRFEVSKIAVSLNPSFDGPFSWYEEEDGWIESNIYECAKDYLK